MKLIKKVLFLFQNLIERIGDLEQTTAYEKMHLEDIVAILIDAYVYEVIYGFKSDTYIIENIICEEFDIMDNVDYSIENSDAIEALQDELLQLQIKVSDELIDMYNEIKDYIGLIMNLERYAFGYKNVQVYIKDVAVSRNYKDITALIEFTVDSPCLLKQ